MNKKALTCVVTMCTYNGEKYVKEQLESIINQTRKPDRIVISDDCSTDNTVEIVKAVLKKCDIEYLFNINETNLGMTAHYEKVISFVEEDVVLGSDQDNVWCDNYIECIMDVFERNKNVDYVFFNGYVTDENLNVIKPIYDNAFFEKSKEKFLYDAINKISFPHGLTTAARSSFLKKIMPPYFAADEWKAICVGATGSYLSINKKIVFFRRHDQSFSDSEKTKHRSNPLKKVFRCSFDEYFIWPDWQYKAYSRYLELFEELLSVQICEQVKKHRDFEFVINALKYNSSLRRAFSFIKLYNTPEYKLYRGNSNTYILDLLFLLFNHKV
jgi:glycosyltransferase involved in cell wall biosynthesis